MRIDPERVIYRALQIRSYEQNAPFIALGDAILDAFLPMVEKLDHALSTLKRER